ncbi:unnamed protein product [Soboliphyme baturini]|uniref:guanylate cyclase n=1 Tax=Soboliphyme baturini TaxID=241478 RepID=A0A183IUJ4_9BILA|nr:unnamed protein product [Soboliphyme baturini]
MAGIFSGRIQTWNDHSLKNLNPSLSLPNTKITPLARQDSSITTKVFTSFLSEFDDSWRSSKGVFSEPMVTENGLWSRTWNRSTSEIQFFSGEDIGPALISITNSVTYLPIFYDVLSKDRVAALMNKANATIHFKKILRGTQAAIEYAIQRTEFALPSNLSYVDIAESYPLSYFIRLPINRTIDDSVIDCSKVAQFFDLLLDAIGSDSAWRTAENFDLVPLSISARPYINEYILKQVSCNGKLIHSLVQNLWQQTPDNEDKIMIPLVFSVCFAVVVLSILVFAIYNRYKVISAYKMKSWILVENDIKFWEYLAEGQKRSTTFSSSRTTVRSTPNTTNSVFNPLQYWKFYIVASGRFRGKEVLMVGSESTMNPLNLQFVTCKRLFNALRLNSDNLIPFIGLVVKDSTIFHVFESTEKSSLHETLASAPYELNEDIKYIISLDVAYGMQYLQKHDIVHGFLDTWNIFLDKNWTAKISCWSHCYVGEAENELAQLIYGPQMIDKVKDDYHIKRLMFRHPNLLTGREQTISVKHDIFSYAMVLVEVFTRELPFSGRSSVIGWRSMLDELTKNPHLRGISPDIPGPIKELVTRMTAPNPQITFDGAIITLQLNQPSTKGIVDILLKTMEDYMSSLEEKVDFSCSSYRFTYSATVTAKMEMLLNSMLPKDVATKLQNGQKVEPEFYQSVTIYFSDIVSFTNLCSESTALEVVNMLNALYTMFDTHIERYDVYKVETIGDAYMCVSGLPRRNGDRHVEQITRLAIDLVKGVNSFVIPHRPNRKLQVRVGINSGPVMSGVVGIKMPRRVFFVIYILLFRMKARNLLPISTFRFQIFRIAYCFL